jgi:hypothetical protein
MRYTVNDVFSGTALQHCDTVEDLLQTPLSDISQALLCELFSRPEYMHEHLQFDAGTKTVYVYWLFSHISDNASWQ